jgi:hypothetical protein
MLPCDGGGQEMYEVDKAVSTSKFNDKSLVDPSPCWFN